jgi:regulator of protease activity HflC (stomatin/prohibitin superfamily)
MSLLVGVVVLALIVLGAVKVFWTTCVAVVPLGHAAVVTRMGRPQRVIGPGIHLLLPLLETAQRPVHAELHDEALAPTPIIDADNRVHDVTVTLRLRVEDPFLATDHLSTLERLATTQLRALLGDVPTADFETRLDQVRQRLRPTLDDAAQRVGARVDDVRLAVEAHG